MTWQDASLVAIGRQQTSPTVLLVDDDESFVTSIKDALGDEPYRLITASNGREALDLLEGMTIDLLVTDLHMPELDGISLAVELFNRNRFIPCIVMSAYATPELEERMERLGVLDMVGKPIDVWALQLKIIQALGRARDGGVVRGLALPSFLQLLAIERKTSTVKVSGPAGSGMLFIRDGELLEATTRNRKGAEAAYEILSWDGVEINLRNECRYRKRVIADKLETLLLDAYRMRDELNAGRPSAPPTPSPLPDREPERSTGAVGLERMMAELQTIEGYLGSAILASSGELLASHTVKPEVDAKAFARVIQPFLVGAHEVCALTGLEPCRSVTIASPSGVLLSECGPDGSNGHLHAVILLESAANIALARWAAEKLLPRLTAGEG
jgi:CheY-like chemotaxis protein